nr:SLC13 family permease [Actinobacillus porcinus]
MFYSNPLTLSFLFKHSPFSWLWAIMRRFLFIGGFMTPSIITLCFLVFAVIMFAWEKLPLAVTAALLAPIGLSIANTLGADPRAVLMAVVVGSSCAFATPIGTPANTMILSVGRYRFADYAKAGLPLILIIIAISMVLLPIFFPFFPAQ